MIVVDTNFLILLFDPEAMPRVDRGGDRVRHFIDKLTEKRETIMIPAPALAELVAGRVDRVEEIVAAIRGYSAFEVQPFDEVIAIETGLLIRRWLDKVPDRPEGSRVPMKYDAQIAATAMVRNARAICTDDQRYDPWLEGTRIEVFQLIDLEPPPEPPQKPFQWAQGE
jgi:predicted nucleic acid-binding protein